MKTNRSLERLRNAVIEAHRQIDGDVVTIADLTRTIATLRAELTAMTVDRDALADDHRRALKVANALTPDTQSCEEMAAELVRLTREGRAERDAMAMETMRLSGVASGRDIALQVADRDRAALLATVAECGRLANGMRGTTLVLLAGTADERRPMLEQIASLANAIRALTKMTAGAGSLATEDVSHG